MFSKVLIALKEGLDHEALLRLATSAAAPGASLRLVTLVKAATDDGPQRLRRAERGLEQEAQRLKAQGYDASFEVGVAVAGAAHDIARIAGERGSDLIVIGLAKRTRVGKALLGSDAQRVLLAAPCPVLVTHLFGH